MTTVMAREIAEQPETLAATLTALLPLRSDLRRLAADRRHVLLAARGSSDNAAVYGRYLLETHAGLPSALAAPSVATRYHRRLDLSDTVAVCLSQSGETEEILETLEWCRECGAATVAVTNVPTSSLAGAADLAMVTRAGVERAVPATKTYTAQLAAMAVLGTALAADPAALDAALTRVPEVVAALLSECAGPVEEAVAVLAEAGDVLVTGRGLVYGTALEVALKLEETCLRPVRGLSYADLRHGPIAVVDADLVAVVVAAADGPMVPAVTDLLAQLRRRGVRATVAIGGDAGFAGAADVAVPGPAALPEAVAPLALVVPGQLCAEALARRLGVDPDAPRGLSKVTQTDPATGQPVAPSPGGRR